MTRVIFRVYWSCSIEKCIISFNYSIIKIFSHDWYVVTNRKKNTTLFLVPTDSNFLRIFSHVPTLWQTAKLFFHIFDSPYWQTSKIFFHIFYITIVTNNTFFSYFWHPPYWHLFPRITIFHFAIPGKSKISKKLSAKKLSAKKLSAKKLRAKKLSVKNLHVKKPNKL